MNSVVFFVDILSHFAFFGLLEGGLSSSFAVKFDFCFLWFYFQLFLGFLIFFFEDKMIKGAESWVYLDDMGRIWAGGSIIKTYSMTNIFSTKKRNYNHAILFQILLTSVGLT